MSVFGKLFNTPATATKEAIPETKIQTFPLPICCIKCKKSGTLEKFQEDNKWYIVVKCTNCDNVGQEAMDSVTAIYNWNKENE